jgi:hypothetical protein
MGEGGNVYRVLVGKPEENRPRGRLRRRSEDGIKVDLREIGLGGGLDSPGSGQGSLAGCCECGDEPSGPDTTELVSQLHLHRSVFITGLIHKFHYSSPSKKVSVKNTVTYLCTRTLLNKHEQWTVCPPHTFSVRCNTNWELVVSLEPTYEHLSDRIS